jgi:hypothetical protein
VAIWPGEGGYKASTKRARGPDEVPAVTSGVRVRIRSRSTSVKPDLEPELRDSRLKCVPCRQERAGRAVNATPFGFRLLLAHRSLCVVQRRAICFNSLKSFD